MLDTTHQDGSPGDTPAAAAVPLPGLSDVPGLAEADCQQPRWIALLWQPHAGAWLGWWPLASWPFWPLAEHLLHSPCPCLACLAFLHLYMVQHLIKCRFMGKCCLEVVQHTHCSYMMRCSHGWMHSPTQTAVGMACQDLGTSGPLTGSA